MEEKITYDTPTMEIVLLENKEIILTSPGGNDLEPDMKMWGLE